MPSTPRRNVFCFDFCLFLAFLAWVSQTQFCVRRLELINAGRVLEAGNLAYSPPKRLKFGDEDAAADRAGESLSDTEAADTLDLLADSVPSDKLTDLMEELKKADELQEAPEAHRIRARAAVFYEWVRHGGTGVVCRNCGSRGPNLRVQGYQKVTAIYTANQRFVFVFCVLFWFLEHVKSGQRQARDRAP